MYSSGIKASYLEKVISNNCFSKTFTDKLNLVVGYGYFYSEFKGVWDCTGTYNIVIGVFSLLHNLKII